MNLKRTLTFDSHCHVGKPQVNAVDKNPPIPRRFHGDSTGVHGSPRRGKVRDLRLSTESTGVHDKVHEIPRSEGVY